MDTSYQSSSQNSSSFTIGNESLSMRYFRQAARYVSWKKWGSGLFWINNLIFVILCAILYVILYVIFYTFSLPSFSFFQENSLGDIVFSSPLIICITVIFLFFLTLFLYGVTAGIIRSLIETAKNPDYKKTWLSYFSRKLSFKIFLLSLFLTFFIGLIDSGIYFSTEHLINIISINPLYLQIGMGVLGLILSFYLGFRFFFTSYVLCDKVCSAWGAFRYSWKITKGHFWNFVRFNLYFGFFNFLGMLCLLVGLVRTLPMKKIALIYYYYQLIELYEKENPSYLLPSLPSFAGQKTSNALGILGVILGILGFILPIIGIFMAGLLPRLTGVQDIARDTNRVVAVSQLQHAIISYRSLMGKYPTQEPTHTNTLHTLIEAGILTELPLDPLNHKYENVFENITLDGDFLYFPVTKNQISGAGIILAAKTETPQKSNYVSLQSNKIDLKDDFQEIIPCKEVTLEKHGNIIPAINNTQEGINHCVATNTDQLWYISKL